MKQREEQRERKWRTSSWFNVKKEKKFIARDNGPMVLLVHIYYIHFVDLHVNNDWDGQTDVYANTVVNNNS